MDRYAVLLQRQAGFACLAPNIIELRLALSTEWRGYVHVLFVLPRNIRMTEQSTAQELRLPAGYKVRPPVREDAQGITDLINLNDVALGAAAEETIEDTYQRWNEPNFDMQQGAWVVENQDGLIVGYEECQDGLHKGELEVDGYVHPEHAGRGIGTFMLRLVEQRGRTLTSTYPDDAHVEMVAHCFSHEQAAVDLFRAEGYQTVRHFWRMQIEMETAPEVPRLPDGIVLRSFVTGQDDRATHAAVTEAFLDHWGSTPTTFEEWAPSRIGVDGFDPTLWFLAVEEATGEIAGCSLGRMRGEDTGWIRSFSVRRPWRKQGLGLALLKHSFGAFYQRGLRKVGLGVDAQSPTGATRLYERAGMRVVHRFDRFARVMREGVTKP